MNTMTGAVSEYDFVFQSITPTHAGSEDALYTLSGENDDGVPITAFLMTGKTLMGTAQKKRLDSVFFSVHGSGSAYFLVQGESGTYSYEFPIRSSGESRAMPGKGIRENYLAFGFANIDGSDFTLDMFEVTTVPTTARRI